MTHYNFNEIYNYLASSKMPDNITDHGGQCNFRRAAKRFAIKDTQLVYLKPLKNGATAVLKVVWDPEEIQSVIREVHSGDGMSAEARAMRGHNGIKATRHTISQRFYWRTITEDVVKYIESCNSCQRSGHAFPKATPSLQSIPVPTKCMSQIGIDICRLPECQGYTYLILAVDYFSKWTEGSPSKDRSAQSVAEFLYRLMCRHGCFDVQINDQGREFVNNVSKEMHRLTGVEQRITSAYHPQSNGLVERQNRTVKDKLMKVIGESQDEWVAALDGVLFAHRVARHRSTGYSPFFLLYGREPKLPIDVWKGVSQVSFTETEEILEEGEHEMLHTVNLMADLRRVAEKNAAEAISRAQESQEKDYDRRHAGIHTFKEGEKVLLRNLKRQDRKGGKSTFPWKGPYVIKRIFPNKTCTLISPNQVVLAAKQHVCNLKPYKDGSEQSEFELAALPVSRALAATGSTTSETFIQLGLTPADRSILIGRGWLNDRIIDAGQQLLVTQFKVNGLQLTVLSESETGFQEPPQPSIQIHYDRERSHWLTSSSSRGRIEVADSLWNGKLTNGLKLQLRQCYRSLAPNNLFTCFFLNVQRQSNGNDCGLHALTAATEFLTDGGDPTSQFEETQLRPHLLVCLEKGLLSPFPKSGVTPPAVSVASVSRF